MAQYRIEENTDWKQWHGVLDVVYAGNKQYIYPLRSDIEDILSDSNAAHKGSNLKKWVVLDSVGTGAKTIGRIAAFVDEERNEQLEFPVGGIGFFEAIEDAEVAGLLFSAAEEWLRERGVEAVDGPINFGERDKFWGLLVRGWYPPIFQETYNPPYYRQFFEDNGYVAYEQCLTMRGVVSDFPGERLGKLAARVRERYGLYTRQIDRKNLGQGADDFAQAYNAAFNHWPYFKPLTGEDIRPTFEQMKPIMDPHLTCIAYTKEGRPIGLAGLIPDINCFLGGVHGKLNWLGLPKFLYRLKFQKQPRNCKGIAFGIAKDYQRQGVYPLMVDAMFQSGDRYTSRTYRYVDMATIRGHNQIMVDTCRQMNAEIHRVHLAYRKRLMEGATWEPFEMVDVSGVAMGVYG